MRFLSAGDRALVVEFGDAVERTLSADVLHLAAAIDAAAIPGVVETVPTFRSLMVHYDPLATRRAALERTIAGLFAHPPEGRRNARLWRIPICVEGGFAPDLGEVARLSGLAEHTVTALHASVRYHVYMLGFLPGFPYLGDLPEPLALPRRADPRLRVPAGAIAIATRLSAIYPYESPGGWHLIGTTPIRLFDVARPRPALLAAGDAVEFEPIGAAAFAAIRRRVERGEHVADSEPLGG
jgi:inhibitor of KinA